MLHNGFSQRDTEEAHRFSCERMSAEVVVAVASVDVLIVPISIRHVPQTTRTRDEHRRLDVEIASPSQQMWQSLRSSLTRGSRRVRNVPLGDRCSVSGRSDSLVRSSMVTIRTSSSCARYHAAVVTPHVTRTDIAQTRNAR